MTTRPYTLTIESMTPTELCARALFPQSHPGFQGHFPGKPILPGFLHVQLALDLLGVAALPHTLKEITAGKFSRPIPPETEIQITLTLTGAKTWDAKLTQNGDTVSAFTLAVE